jgi:Spy/CpxP family protein refolding chaperone
MEVLEQLGLTATQRTKITKLRDESERKLIRAEADTRIADLDLRQLIESDDPDRDAIEAAIETVGRLRTRMHQLRVSTWLDLRAVLTTDQRAKLRALARSGPPDRDGGPDGRSRPGRSGRP